MTIRPRLAGMPANQQCVVAPATAHVDHEPCAGLAAGCHLPGISCLPDGIALNNLIGGDGFQDLDPTAFRYAETDKGAKGLRYVSLCTHLLLGDSEIVTVHD